MTIDLLDFLTIFCAYVLLLLAGAITIVFVIFVKTLLAEYLGYEDDEEEIREDCSPHDEN